MTAVEDFAADYFVREQLTPKRQTDVRRALTALEASAGAAPETLDDRALRGFVRDLVEDGMHPNTVRKYLHAVKPFYGWAAREGIVDGQVYWRIRDVRPPRGATNNARPRPYKRVEIERFWDELDERFALVPAERVRRFTTGVARYRRVWRHAMHLQIQAIASLALFGGLRQTEIRLLGMDDLHPDNEFVVVRGKSPVGEAQGYREVPYTVEGRRMVAEWLDFRALLKPHHDGPWLVLDPHASPNGRFGPSSPTNPMTVNSFAELLNRVGKGWELHRFRHTCATEWLRAGVEIELVSRLLGHATLQQTLCYAELVAGDVARGLLKGEQDFVTAVGKRNRRLIPSEAA